MKYVSTFRDWVRRQWIFIKWRRKSGKRGILLQLSVPKIARRFILHVLICPNIRRIQTLIWRSELGSENTQPDNLYRELIYSDAISPFYICGKRFSTKEKKMFFLYLWYKILYFFFYTCGIRFPLKCQEKFRDHECSNVLKFSSSFFKNTYLFCILKLFGKYGAREKKKNKWIQ